MDKYCGCIDVDTTLNEVGTYCESGFVQTHRYASFYFHGNYHKYTAKVVIL